jgi:catechol 2,3-dioxygenase-like lactoylglutathione lyase family enzyme
MASAMGAAAALRLTHCSLAVDDLDRAVAFYTEAFGCTVDFREDGITGLIEGVVGIPGQTCDLAILTIPGSEVMLELIAFRNPGAPVAARPPAGHVEFAVGDLDESIAVVERLGARLVGAVTVFPEGPSVYCCEPGGSVFELTEYRT